MNFTWIHKAGSVGNVEVPDMLIGIVGPEMTSELSSQGVMQADFNNTHHKGNTSGAASR